ncbi:VgrG-related protein [Georgenia faecalis]|uniref:VgrG-related protein n=1 Tax=Georgenia faecalis TaxID=2483799 RepID=A0ABV9DA87_9MICO|nr:VgrG-related protein [Georgenia faecalis]
MPGEEYAHTPVVTVAGTPMNPDVAATLVAVEVDESRHLPALAVLRFSDPHDRVLTALGARMGAPMTVSVQSSGSGGPTPLIDAEITAIERDIGPEGAFTVVRGLDRTHRLHGASRVRAFPDMTASDIVRVIAGEVGMVGETQAIGPKFTHLAQDGLTDWDFLHRLADTVGAVISVQGRTLRFARPGDAARAPTGGARQSTAVIEAGVNLLALRATVTGTGQVPGVEVRGWDVTAKKALVATAPTATAGAVLGSTTPKTLAATVGGRTHVEPVSAVGTMDHVDARTAPLAERRAAGFAELDGVVRGNPHLHAGTAVTLRGAGAFVDGKYLLSSVHHELDPDLGYRTSFTVAGGSDRSTYGVLGGGRQQTSARIPGVLTGVVTNLRDPENLGRVRITFPVLDNQYESWWARTVQAGAGKGRGAVVLPEVGDEVLVAFGQGDFQEPYVLGGLYNGKDAPTAAWSEHVGQTDGAVIRRAWVSRTGLVVEMLEKPGEEKLTLRTADGQRITLVQKADKAIEIVSGGPVTVTAKADVSVTAEKNVSVSTSTGDVAVRGKNVTLEATSALTLKGMKVAVEGSTAVEVTGATVKVSANATAELAANATTTIRGALVRIN